MTPISSLADTTGTFSERATRSAVRCRVPVSTVGTVGSGTRWTLARAIRLPSDDRMIAPSILASSDSRCGLYGASTRNPPEQIVSTSGPSSRTSRAPALGADHPVDAVTQRRSRRHPGQRVAQLVVGARGRRHHRLAGRSTGPRSAASPTGPCRPQRLGQGGDARAARMPSTRATTPARSPGDSRAGPPR